MENQPTQRNSLSLAGISFGRKESPKEFESLLGYHYNFRILRIIYKGMSNNQAYVLSKIST